MVVAKILMCPLMFVASNGRVCVLALDMLSDMLLCCLVFVLAIRALPRVFFFFLPLAFRFLRF